MTCFTLWKIKICLIFERGGRKLPKRNYSRVNKNKPKWYSVDELKNFRNRTHVIYLLCNTVKNQFYVGKADKFGERVKKGKGRLGLDDDWDQFMFFELDPELSSLIYQLEDFGIRLFSSIMENEVGVKPLKGKSNLKLVNKASLRKK